MKKKTIHKNEFHIPRSYNQLFFKGASHRVSSNVCNEGSLKI